MVSNLNDHAQDKSKKNKIQRVNNIPISFLSVIHTRCQLATDQLDKTSKILKEQPFSEICKIIEIEFLSDNGLIIRYNDVRMAILNVWFRSDQIGLEWIGSVWNWLHIHLLTSLKLCYHSDTNFIWLCHCTQINVTENQQATVDGHSNPLRILFRSFKKSTELLFKNGKFIFKCFEFRSPENENDVEDEKKTRQQPR